MVDTVYADISEFQARLTDAYPHRWVAFRSNDGTYRDAHFASNLTWAKSAIARGRLDAFIVYVVFRPDGGAWVDKLMSNVGTPHPRMVVMIDVESWGGQIKGDHSTAINAGRARIAKWLGNPARVIGYGNGYDLRSLWPNRGDAKIVLAAYGSNPSFPNKIAHQYTDRGACAPFGTCDMNSADGYSSTALMKALGVAPAPAPAPTPTPVTPPLVVARKKENRMILAVMANGGKNAAGKPCNLWAVTGPGYYHEFTGDSAGAALEDQLGKAAPVGRTWLDQAKKIALG